VLNTLQKLIRLEWPVRLANPLFGWYNPFLPEYRRDPYPFLHALRAHDPVYFSRVLRGWILTRYTDVVAVLQSPGFSVERQRSNIFRRLAPLQNLDPDFSQALLRILLMVDAPDHTRLRGLVSKAFTPRMVERLRPRIEGIVGELLDGIEGRDEIDLIETLAYPLPVVVIAEMLGVPAEDRVQLKRWSDHLATVLDPLQAEDGMSPVQRSFGELREYLRPILADRRREPRDDLISALVTVEEQGQVLTEAELVSLAMLLLAAGNETTTNLIGNAFVALLRHPDERRRLQSDPTLIRSAVDEFLRYDSPVQATDRVALRDCEVGGKAVRAGQIVAVSLAAANRDPEQFPDPDRLDVARGDSRVLSFGHGAHFCLGAALARLEAQAAIAGFLARFPDFDGGTDGLEWKRSIVLRGPLALPLRLGPPACAGITPAASAG
jgi:hypothetical protein